MVSWRWYLNNSYIMNVYHIDIRTVEDHVKVQMGIFKYFQAQNIKLIFAIIEMASMMPIKPVPWAGFTWWRHQMETFFAWGEFTDDRWIPRTKVRGIHRSSVNSPHKGQWRGALMFSLICSWINGWVNSRKAGDLRRNGAHCGVTTLKIEDVVVTSYPLAIPYFRDFIHLIIFGSPA